jgi:DNA repair photolyase
VTLEDGTKLVASGDHRFLTDRGWRYVQPAGGAGEARHLTIGSELVGTGAFEAPPTETMDYRQGYVCGIVQGDGLLAECSFGPEPGGRWHFVLALADDAPLVRAQEYLRSFDVGTASFSSIPALEDRGVISEIRTHARPAVERIEQLVELPPAPVPDWRKGLLAGAFDARGSYRDGILRMTNLNVALGASVTESLVQLGFAFRVERQRVRACRALSIRIGGGLREHLRFLHLTGPAIRGKCSIEGLAMTRGARLGVVSVEPLGPRPLFDITTGTGDFIANGVVSHNCFARPTHEWLGLSAGLDFETKIFVKEDAPELLREAIASRRWTGEPIALSGVTDPYQPIERKLRITRRCLEVLAEARNPVAMITKNHLITRDADLLGELASFGGAMVNISITTLDPELQRVMEPRASTPSRRLDAVRTLTAAGVPVGVLVAPVIPGLTDHELPAILQAAAGAGARCAGFVPLRLPYGLADLFERWLETHFPARKEKVLNRVREIRGGRLNDPNFGSRMTGEGEYADQIRALFHVACRKAGLDGERVELSSAAFRKPHPGGQLGLEL